MPSLFPGLAGSVASPWGQSPVAHGLLPLIPIPAPTGWQNVLEGQGPSASVIPGFGPPHHGPVVGATSHPCPLHTKSPLPKGTTRLFQEGGLASSIRLRTPSLVRLESAYGLPLPLALKRHLLGLPVPNSNKVRLPKTGNTAFPLVTLKAAAMGPQCLLLPPLSPSVG